MDLLKLLIQRLNDDNWCCLSWRKNWSYWKQEAEETDESTESDDSELKDEEEAEEDNSEE